MTPYCTSYTYIETDGQQTFVAPIKCRSWTCPACAPERKQRLAAEALSGNPNTLLTLTVRPSRRETPSDRAVLLSHAFRRLIRAARTRFKLKDLAYYAVFEKTQLGEPHLHVLIRGGFIPQRWISAFMRRAIAAPICDIRHIDSARKAAAYVSKYLTKDPTRFGKSKRYWCSPNYKTEWVKPEGVVKTPGTSHFTVQVLVHQILKEMAELGRDIVEHESGYMISGMYWMGPEERRRKKERGRPCDV